MIFCVIYADLINSSARTNSTYLIVRDWEGGRLVLCTNPHGCLLEDVGEITKLSSSTSELVELHRIGQSPTRNSSSTCSQKKLLFEIKMTMYLVT